MPASLMPAQDTVLVQINEQEALAATQADERMEMGHDAPMQFKWTIAIMGELMAIGEASENGPKVGAEVGDMVVLDPSCVVHGLRVQEGLFLIGAYNVRAVVKDSPDAAAVT